MSEHDLQSIDEIVREFLKDFRDGASPRNLKNDRRILSLPVPEKYKAKYDDIQAVTKKTFNRKVLEPILIRVLDMIDVDALKTNPRAG